MNDNPFTIFEEWYEEAKAGALADNAAAEPPAIDPDAIALASADKDGRPSVRFVFFRGIREGGFSFFTNYESRKGCEFNANPAAALAFWWPHLGKQVRVEGAVERLSNRESDAYFNSRPLESRISAIVSRQSRRLDNKEVFLSQLKNAEEKAGLQPLSRPEYWGGFKVVPARFEFWIRGEHRRHQRLVLEKHGQCWTMKYLYP